MSTELKKEYNALIPEHNAFLRKESAATKYSRQVRKYLETKEQQERNRAPREKAFSAEKERLS